MVMIINMTARIYSDKLLSSSNAMVDERNFSELYSVMFQPL